MLEGKKGVCTWMILMTTTRMSSKMKRIKLHEGMSVPKGERRGRGFRRNQRWQDEIDKNLGNIKMKIPPYQGKNNPEAYLE